MAVQTDVSVRSQVENLVDRVTAEIGPIDILVNNAVVYARGALHELPETEWDKTIDAGLKGYHLCAQAVVTKSMIPRKKGCIINLASTSGHPAHWKAGRVQHHQSRRHHNDQVACGGVGRIQYPR